MYLSLPISGIVSLLPIAQDCLLSVYQLDNQKMDSLWDCSSLAHGGEKISCSELLLL